MSRSAGAERPRPVPRRPASWWPVALLLLLATPAAAGDAGQRPNETGHDEEAVRTWRTQAKAGDKDASFALGVAYDTGTGVAPDPVLACRYYSEAGDQGHVSGAFNAGIMNDIGRCGGSRRADLAATWYARAAVAGSARAEFNLAQLYAAGDGVPRNPAVAAAWFRAAAASGILAAAGRSNGALHAGNGPGPLLPVTPVFPNQAQSLVGSDATLVWTAPVQPAPARVLRAV